MTIGISDVYRIRSSTFNESDYSEHTYRLWDRNTKILVDGLRHLLDKAYPDGYAPCDDIGIIVASISGATQAIYEIYNMYLQRGYVGINPAKFPHIMMSSVLNCCVKELETHGFSSVMYYSHNDKKAVIEYACLQLYSYRCKTCILCFMDEKGNVLYMLIEPLDVARQNGRNIRFILHGGWEAL